MSGAADDARRRVFAAIDAGWDRQVEFLRGLVSRPSTLGQEALVQRFVAAELSEMGLDVDVWEVDPAVIARLPGYGPVECGAGDMKAGVAAMVYPVRALLPAGAGLRGDVSVVTVIEEECTGNGALSALARGYTGDAAVIPEPFGLRALEAQVGVLWARVIVRGQGAHAERATEVQNAIVKAARVVEAVGVLEQGANRPQARHHAPDEWVGLESVRQVTRVLAATALDWCGVA